MKSRKKKSVILAITAIMLVVLSLLALVALFVMTQEARVAEHKIKRIRAYYATKAGLVHAFEQLRRGHAQINGTSIVNTTTGAALAPLAVGDVNVTFSAEEGAGPNNTDILSATITY